MAELWFSVIDDAGGIIVRTHICGLESDKPLILTRILELVNAGGNDGMRILAEEFPSNAKVIDAINNLLSHHKVRGASGIHWSDTHEHSVHINIE